MEFDDHERTEQKPLPSITELPNNLTQNMDLSDPEGIVRLLRQVDAQIVNGYRDYPAIADREMLDRFSNAVDRILEILDRPGRSCVVISGAGTSGRLAMLAAREINQFLRSRKRPALARYTIAGAAGAIVRAEEGAEDLPSRGAEDLEKVIANSKNVVYIGITCGMSAPYIAGQLEWAKDRPDTLCILLGFTTLERARRITLKGWDKTFADVAGEIASDERHILLTPVVGPEAITGSTRMKSGTATNIVLQLLIFCAFVRQGVLSEQELAALGFKKERTIDSLRRFLLQYETARNIAYLQSDHLAEMIDAAGDALRRGRHVYYLGSGNFGILGLIDASECPPTFGASFHDVRGFVEGGWKTILGDEEEPPAPRSATDEALFRIGLEDFERDLLPDVQEGDFVIALSEGELSERLEQLIKASRERGATTGTILVSPAPNHRWVDVDIFTPVPVPTPGYVEGNTSFAEVAVKLLLNGITTGAHVLKGKVYRNYMVDLRITNSKLYVRAQNLISQLLGIGSHHAEAALQSAIYATDSLKPQQMSASIQDHVAAAAAKDRVVPTAMLIATGRFGYEEAREALEREPVVRQLLVEHLPQHVS